MTRDEFLEVYRDWNFDQIYEFAKENDVANWGDIVFSDDLDREICSEIREQTTHEYWNEIRDALNCIESGYDYYVHDGTLSYEPVDEESFVEDIISDMDSYDLWDEPEEDNDEEDDEDEEEDDSEPEPDPEPALDDVQVALKAGVFSIDEFIESGAGDMMVLRDTAERYEEAQAEMQKAAEEAFAAEQKTRPAGRKFKVGDCVMANERSDVYSVTCKNRGWRGVVVDNLSHNAIRVIGRGNSDEKDNMWVVDEDKFDLDDSFDVPKEDPFTF